MTYSTSINLKVYINPFWMRLLYAATWMAKAGLRIQIGNRKRDFYLLSSVWIDRIAKLTTKVKLNDSQS